MAAKFQVDAVFSIVGRGTVLQGRIISGQIASGMRITIPGTQMHCQVLAVEAIHGTRISVGSVGLVLDGSGSDDLVVLRGAVVDLT